MTIHWHGGSIVPATRRTVGTDAKKLGAGALPFPATDCPLLLGVSNCPTICSLDSPADPDTENVSKSCDSDTVTPRTPHTVIQRPAP